MDKNTDAQTQSKIYDTVDEKQMKSVGYTSSETETSGLKLNLVKIFIIVISGIIFLLLAYIFIKRLTKKKKNFTISDFQELIPKINLESNTLSTDINELFKSRRLYINDKNISNDYIDFIRPINQKEEDKYNQVLSQDESFNEYLTAKKEGQLKLEEFYNLCNREKIIDSNKIPASDEPNVSIIIPLLTRKPEIIRSMNSIISQTFKNIEIIIVDDSPIEDNTQTLQYLFENEPRLRIFKHMNKMGLWRSRMSGFLYSKGKYILHFDPGDLFADNYVLEDIYNLVTKYNLDTVRYTFSKTRYNNDFLVNQKFNEMKVYPSKHTKIIYGRPDYNVHEFGYGTLWNRLVRASLFRKGLDLVDEYILNVYKDLWEDMWWNDLIDRVSFSNLVVNRLGYILLYNSDSPGEPKIGGIAQRDRTIREFILFWYFDYQLLPKKDNKANIVQTLRNYSKRDNKFCRLPMSLYFLNSNFPILDRLLLLLYNDPYVSGEDKKFVYELYNNSPKNL